MLRIKASTTTSRRIALAEPRTVVVNQSRNAAMLLIQQFSSIVLGATALRRPVMHRIVTLASISRLGAYSAIIAVAAVARCACLDRGGNSGFFWRIAGAAIRGGAVFTIEAVATSSCAVTHTEPTAVVIHLMWEAELAFLQLSSFVKVFAAFRRPKMKNIVTHASLTILSAIASIITERAIARSAFGRCGKRSRRRSGGSRWSTCGTTGWGCRWLN